MYHDLYEYLVLHKQLSVPGIGTFLVERKPAGTDFVHRQINPPAYTISLHNESETPAKKFFYWLADKLHVHYHEAIVRFNGFAYDLKNEVLSGKKIIWDNVGELSKGLAGDIRFEPALKESHFDPPVSAAKIIREKAVHNVMVGEEEKTSAEMTEWLHPEEKAEILLVGNCIDSSHYLSYFYRYLFFPARGKFVIGSQPAKVISAGRICHL